MTLQPSIFAGTTGCCLQVIFCFICAPAHLHLHISVVLDLELDLWCLHAVNMMQSFTFAVSTDHSREWVYSNGRSCLCIWTYSDIEFALNHMYPILTWLSLLNNRTVHTAKCMFSVHSLPMSCSRDAAVAFSKTDTFHIYPKYNF